MTRFRRSGHVRNENRLRMIALILLAAGGTGGCSSGSGPNSTNNTSSPVIAANAIVFESSRALDGSDASNKNGASNIWVMNSDGSAPIPLTKLTSDQSSLNLDLRPRWSRDGSRIIFQSARALDGSDAIPSMIFNIWVMNPDGSSQTPLTKLTGASSFNPAWSPGGSRVAFTSLRALNGSDAANGVSNIWAMNPDGSTQTPLTRITATGADSDTPVWSPDGKKIVFTSKRALNGNDAANTNFTSNIWLMNADGSGQGPLTQITAAVGDSVQPAWSPNGSKIVFTSDRALDGSDAALPFGEFNIWTVNSDGSGATPLTKLALLNTASSQPGWSPDGSKIAFNSSRAFLNGNGAGGFNIWVMNADGSSQTPLTQLTAPGANSLGPVWSADGSKILFFSSGPLSGANVAAQFNIWIGNADGSGATPLTRLTNASSISPSQR